MTSDTREQLLATIEQLLGLPPGAAVRVEAHPPRSGKLRLILDPKAGRSVFGRKRALPLPQLRSLIAQSSSRADFNLAKWAGRKTDFRAPMYERYMRGDDRACVQAFRDAVLEAWEEQGVKWLKRSDPR